MLKDSNTPVSPGAALVRHGLCHGLSQSPIQRRFCGNLAFVSILFILNMFEK
jgi:hypothetical protein